MWYVYILQCADSSLYTGITNNLTKRFAAHREGHGSKYVAAHLPFEHVYTEKFSTKSHAAKREFEIKSWNRPQKLRLVKTTSLKSGKHLPQ
jgi:putative endonuclease